MKENYVQTFSQITELFDDISNSKVGINAFLMLISLIYKKILQYNIAQYYNLQNNPLGL